MTAPILPPQPDCPPDDWLVPEAEEPGGVTLGEVAWSAATIIGALVIAGLVLRGCWLWAGVLFG